MQTFDLMLNNNITAVYYIQFVYSMQLCTHINILANIDKVKNYAIVLVDN